MPFAFCFFETKTFTLIHHLCIIPWCHLVQCYSFYIPVSSIVVGVLIFTTNHMKLDEDTMVSNNMGMFQMSISKVSWACWLSASATPSAVLTVLFLALNIVFFWIRQLSESECLRLHIHVSSDLTVLLWYSIVSVWKGLNHDWSILSIYTFYTNFLILTN